MSRVQNILRGVVLASVLVLVPAVAKAGGGCYNFGCYPKFCSPCYSSCYSPCYQTYPLYYSSCYTPCVQTYVVQQPIIQQPLVRTFATPYVASYGCKVYIHKK